ncbi:MAG: bile acid:sodium symporter [Deltaproteobacteria bacterium]|nr:bile acid:sodium symporter [Deltaproteobacteria bacterium]
MLRSIFVKNWFFVGIAAMVLTAFYLPQVGLFVKTYKILNVAIFLGFLVTGLTLDTSSIVTQLKNVKVLLAALISSLFLFPVIAYFLALLFFKAPPDIAVGALIIGTAPATVASGTVMTAIALGNIPLSLFICVLTSFASLLTIPLILSLLLQYTGTSVDLPAMQMLLGLSVKVLLPTVIGQLLRPRLKAAIAPYGKQISIFNQCIVLMIVLNAVSSSAEKILASDVIIVWIFLLMIGLHLLILSINFTISHLIRLDLPSTAAFTIHTSQKTLTISYLVWAGHFYHSHPMALIPPIAYHLTQSVVDTWIAHRFRSKVEQQSIGNRGENI